MKIKCSLAVYLLVLLIEEAAEVIHRACKAIRFGLEERYQSEDPTNGELLQGEINDFVGAVALLKNHGVLAPQHVLEEALQTEKKIKRVTHFAEYSRQSCKTLIEDLDLDENPGVCYKEVMGTQGLKLPQKD